MNFKVTIKKNGQKIISVNLSQGDIIDENVMKKVTIINKTMFC